MRTYCIQLRELYSMPCGDLNGKEIQERRIYIYIRSMLGSGRSPRGGNDNPFQYSCKENSVDRGS